MYLVDTSVWIDFLRKRDNPPVARFLELTEQSIPFGITGVIYQEVLQGAETERDFERLRDHLSTQRFYHPHDPVTSYLGAAQLYFQCRRQGVTLRSTIDCLIAQIAIEYELKLLHNDSDFERIANVVSDLKLA
ncbi:MAG: type II toxin-antitoxin system VapC family toxin [Burkholderiales bacterium]